MTAVTGQLITPEWLAEAMPPRSTPVGPGGVVRVGLHASVRWCDYGSGRGIEVGVYSHSSDGDTMWADGVPPLPRHGQDRRKVWCGNLPWKAMTDYEFVDLCAGLGVELAGQTLPHKSPTSHTWEQFKRWLSGGKLDSCEYKLLAGKHADLVWEQNHHTGEPAVELRPHGAEGGRLVLPWHRMSWYDVLSVCEGFGIPLRSRV